MKRQPTCFRQMKYTQSVKDQREDVHGVHLHPALSGQPPWKPGSNLGIHLSLYLRPISLQLEVGSEPHLEDADGSVTLAKGLWQGIAAPPRTELQAFAFVKLDLGSCYSYSATAFFTAIIARQRDTKTVISSANVEILAVRGPPRKVGFSPSSLSLRSRGSKART